MTSHRPTGAPEPGPRPEGDVEHDRLAEAVADALRSREPDAAYTAATAHLIAARVTATAAGRSGVVAPLVRRAGTVAVTGVVVSALGVAGAAAAAAANPYTEFAAVVDGVVQAVGIDWSSMPDGYTREQYEAFWGAGYSAEDQEALQELWSLDHTEAKARAGQKLLDGERLPFEPGGHTTPELQEEEEQAATDAFIDAGYSHEEARALSALWGTDFVESKVRAGKMLLDGKQLPLP